MARQKGSSRNTLKKKKKGISLSKGILYVKTTENNTIVTLTDINGNKISGGGTGLIGYKGTKKSTPYAAEMLTKQILMEASKEFGLKKIGIIFKGTGLSRDAVFKAVNEVLLEIQYIKESTPIQFGGCKRKRLKRN